MPVVTDDRRLAPEPSIAQVSLIAAPAQTTPRPARRPAALPRIAVLAAVLLGVGLRGVVYARNPSLWIDEAMLALNVIYKPAAELLQPLGLNQGAPVGYLLASKLVVQAFGPSEFALRALSLVAGLAGLGLFVPLAYRALPLPVARIAVALFALSPYLVGYSAEFKQYELDATVAVGLLLLGLPVWRNEASHGRLVALAAAGATAVWFSHPAAFVLGGVGLAALADAAVRRDRAALTARLLVVGAWAVSFGVCYLLFTRKLGMNQYLLDYWAGKFMPLPAYKPGHFAWVFHHFFEAFDKPGGFSATVIGASGLAGVLYLIGALVLARTDWRLLVAVVTPLVLALLASGLHKYPFANRLLLFAVPGMLVLVAYGAWEVARRLGSEIPGAGAVVLACVFAAPVAECHWQTKRPIHAEDAREAVAHVHRSWQPGDRCYVFYGAAAAFAYYRDRYPLPQERVTFGVENRGKGPEQFQRELEPYRGARRVWVIVAHRQSREEAAVRAYLDGMGRCEETVRMTDAVVWRYDLSGQIP
ncbi:MAG: hypothetical protein U0871_20210 [Gemmataceae bacterium]